MLKYTHGSHAGNGATLEVDIETRLKDCKVLLKMARQTNNGGTISTEGERWEFDDPRPVQMKLNAQQVSRVLSVLRGEADSIFPGQGGMVIVTPEFNAILYLEKWETPREGFNLHIKQTWADGEQFNGRILLNPNEALCLRLALESVMGKLAFGK